MEKQNRKRKLGAGLSPSEKCAAIACEALFLGATARFHKLLGMRGRDAMDEVAELFFAILDAVPDASDERVFARLKDAISIYKAFVSENKAMGRGRSVYGDFQRTLAARRLLARRAADEGETFDTEFIPMRPRRVRRTAPVIDLAHERGRRRSPPT